MEYCQTLHSNKWGVIKNTRTINIKIRVFRLLSCTFSRHAGKQVPTWAEDGTVISWCQYHLCRKKFLEVLLIYRVQYPA
jgi:hypothetical protein